MLVSEHTPEQLGSLAQSARKGNLSQARGILITIGILQLIGHIVLYFVMESQIADRRQAGDPVDEEALSEARALLFVAMGLGLTFTILGILVYRIPVAATVTGLLLYLADKIYEAVLDPTNLRAGLIIKIIIVVCLVKAVQAAIAYEREAASESNDTPSPISEA